MNINQEENFIQGYFSSEHINRIGLDQEVQFIFTDGDNNRHFISGRIEVISQEPLNTENGNFFILKASIDPDSTPILQYGVSGELNILTGRTTYFRYLISRFFKSK